MHINKSIKFIRAKSGDLVPTINKVHLHSDFDPIKEAKEFAHKIFQTIHPKQKEIVSLGLGWGYHLDQLDLLFKRSQRDININVIEPNEDLINIFKAKKRITLSKYKIWSHKDVQQYYSDEEYCRLLYLKPKFIIHKPSFELNTFFFTSLLKYRRSTNVEDFYSMLDQRVSSHLYNKRNENVESITSEISEKNKNLNKSDLFWEIYGCFKEL